MGGMRNACSISVEKSESKRPFVRQNRRWEYNNKMDEK
jgi:hypothetical protein